MSRSDCVFCDRDRIESEVKDTFWRGTGFMVFEPLDPVTRGHKLYVPAEHIRDAASNPRLAGLTFELAALDGGLLHDDFNLITNVGSAATQTVWHFHVHLVPRRAGDRLPLPWSRLPEPSVDGWCSRCRSRHKAPCLVGL